jgi:hypothetical protein
MGWEKRSSALEHLKSGGARSPAQTRKRTGGSSLRAGLDVVRESPNRRSLMGLVVYLPNGTRPDTAADAAAEQAAAPVVLVWTHGPMWNASSSQVAGTSTRSTRPSNPRSAALSLGATISGSGRLTRRAVKGSATVVREFPPWKGEPRPSDVFLNRAQSLPVPSRRVVRTERLRNSVRALGPRWKEAQPLGDPCRRTRTSAVNQEASSRSLVRVAVGTGSLRGMRYLGHLSNAGSPRSP